MAEPVRALFPVPDGGLIVLSSTGDRSTLRRLRPPERTIMDSATIATPTFTAMSPLGDRLYLAYGSDVAALNATTFAEVARVRFAGPVTALATTPSGDRVFVATEGSRTSILDPVQR